MKKSKLDFVIKETNIQGSITDGYFVADDQCAKLGSKTSFEMSNEFRKIRTKKY